MQERIMAKFDHAQLKVIYPTTISGFAKWHIRNTGAHHADDSKGNTNYQPVKAQVLPTKQNEWPDWITAIILGAVAGIVGVLLAIWAPALYVDGQATTRLVGLCAFLSTFRGLKFIPSKWRYLVPPTSG
jgi:hypothetical protein